MVELAFPEAMADQGPQEPLQISGLGEAMADQETREAWPKNFSWGELGLLGGAQEEWALEGALEERN